MIGLRTSYRWNT